MMTDCGKMMLLLSLSDISGKIMLIYDKPQLSGQPPLTGLLPSLAA